MAYDFTAASSQYLRVAVSPVAAEPITLACWFNRKTSGTTQRLVSIDRGESAGSFFHTLSLNSTSLTVASNDGSGAFATATVNPSLNTWNHACGVVLANNSRTIYLNGGNAATNTTLKTVTGLSNTTIGGLFENGLFRQPANALIAEVGIWSAALTQPEIASLADGMTCDKVRPQSLAFYAPLIRDLQDVKGGRIITPVNNATVATHPRIYK